MALTEEDVKYIETLVKELMKHKELVENTQRWKPKLGEAYYFFGESIGVGSYSWKNDEADNGFYNFGNCFPTKELALSAAEKVKQLLKSL